MYKVLKPRFFVACVVVAGAFAFNLPETHARLSADAVTSVSVVGTAGLESDNLNRSFEGQISITELSLDGDQLIAEGFISGTATGSDGTSTILNQTFQTEAAISVSGNGGNAVITVDLASEDLDVVGLTVDVAPVDISLSSLKGNERNLGNLLVKVPGLLASGNTSKILKQLSRINSILGSFYKNVEVDGSVTSGSVNGTLNGFFTLEELSIEGDELIFTGLLNAVVVVDGETTAIINETVTTSGSIELIGSGKIGIELDLSPFTSEVVEGLEVDLLPVTLDTSEVTGTGRLLVNSFRKLSRFVVNTDVLDVKKAAKAVAKINKLL